MNLSSSTIYAAIAFAIAVYLFRVVGVFTRFPGTLGDARFNQVVLEHLWIWISGRADSLSDPAFFYPYRDILYFSDTHFGTGWIYALARALGAPREAAFDVWFLCGMASTFAASAYVFRRLGLATASTIVGACLFTFSLPMLAQDPHAQLAYRFGVPLACLACIQFSQKPSVRQASLIAIWVAWQLLCSVYIGVFLVELLALMGAVATLRPAMFPRLADNQPAAPTKAQDLALGAVALVVVALAALMLVRYAEVARLYAIRRDMSQIGQMAPQWYSLMTMAGAPSVGWLTAFLPHAGEYWGWEHQLFPGVGVLMLAAAGARLSWSDDSGRRVTITCLVAIVGLLALVMDFGGVGLYRYLSELPGLNAIRSPGRVVIVMQFPLTWLAALGVSALRRSPTRDASIYLLFALAVSLLDIAAYRSASVDIAEARARVAAISSGLDVEALRAQRAVLMRFGDRRHQEDGVFDIDLMVAAQDMGLSAFNGYSGSIPPLWKSPQNCGDARAWIERAAQLPYKRAGAETLAARAVIIPPGACEPAAGK